MEVGLILVGVPLLALAALALYFRVQGKRAERQYPPQGRFIELDGVRLRYLERGQGPALVLLHGNGALIEDFVASGVFELASRSYRVIAFDRPGFGYSSRPRGQAWTPERQAALLRSAWEQLGIVRPVVVGHSWGTLVTLALALHHAEAIRGVVLASGYYFPTPRLDVALLSPPALPVVGDVLRYTVSPLLARLMMDKIVEHLFAPQPVPPRFRRGFPVPLTLRPWQIRAAAEETALMVPAAARLSAAYAQIRLPVAVVVGEGDRLIDPQVHSARLHHELAGSTFLPVADAGHMVHYAAPEQIIAAVVALEGKPQVGRRREA
jgi:pimeloyl-ACP methyl ester carboxylesterase